MSDCRVIGNSLCFLYWLMALEYLSMMIVFACISYLQCFDSGKLFVIDLL